MADKDYIIELKTPDWSIYEPGLYVNFYRHKSDGLWIESDYFESPKEAEKNINWTSWSLEYQFTAKVTDKIHKFEHP